MFGDRLKELRFKKKMTQRDLAKYLNITQSAVARYESDSGGMPSQDILIKMADLFGVSTDYLLGRDVNLSEEEAEIMEIRETLRRKPEYRMLFSVTKDATKEEILAVADFFKKIKGEHRWKPFAKI